MKIEGENKEVLVTPSKAGCEFLRESYNVVFAIAIRV